MGGIKHNPMILKFVQTGLGNVAPGQSDQGLHCFPFGIHLLDTQLSDKTTVFKFFDNYSNFSHVLII